MVVSRTKLLSLHLSFPTSFSLRLFWHCSDFLLFHLRKEPSVPELCQPFFLETTTNAVMKKESTLVISKLLSLIFGLTGLQRFLQGKKLALQITYLFSPAVKIFRKSTGKSASFESLTIKLPAEWILWRVKRVFFLFLSCILNGVS